MNLYKTHWFKDTSEDGTSFALMSKWDGTQADASATRAAAKRDDGAKAITETVNVPTDKAGLLAFLNSSKP